MKKKRRKLPKNDALLTPGYVARLRDCSDQTIVNAISDGRLAAVKVYSSEEAWAFAVLWKDAKAFTARAYAVRG